MKEESKRKERTPPTKDFKTGTPLEINLTTNELTASMDKPEKREISSTDKEPFEVYNKTKTSCSLKERIIFSKDEELEDETDNSSKRSIILSNISSKEESF